jgi:hypothetical protein
MTQMPQPREEEYDAFGVIIPDNPRRRIGRLMAQTPRVDSQGRNLVSAVDPSVQTIVQGDIPKMADVIVQAAETLGVDARTVVENQDFLVAIGSISPTDDRGVLEAVASAAGLNPPPVAAPTPGMKPNPAQGRASAPAPLRPATPRGRIGELSAHLLGRN